MRPRWIPILGTVVDQADTRIGSRMHELSLHRREARCRRSAEAVPAQEPAQQIPRTMRSARVESDQRSTVECRADGLSVDRIQGVLLRKLVGEHRRFGLVRGAAGERSGIPRKGGAKPWCDFVPNEVALDVGVRVRLVVDPSKSPRGRVRADRRSRQCEKGAQQHRTAGHRPQRRHRGKPVRTGAAQELQQQGFRLIVGVMGECDEIDGSVGERGIPGRSRRGFEARATAPLDLRAMDGEGHAALSAFVRAKRDPGFGVRRKAMMHVQGR